MIASHLFICFYLGSLPVVTHIIFIFFFFLLLCLCAKEKKNNSISGFNYLSSFVVWPEFLFCPFFSSLMPHYYIKHCLWSFGVRFLRFVTGLHLPKYHIALVEILCSVSSHDQRPPAVHFRFLNLSVSRGYARGRRSDHHKRLPPSCTFVSRR